MRDSRALSIVKDAMASIAGATGEECVEHTPEFVSLIGEYAFEGAALTLAEGIASAVAPGAYAAAQGYKMRRIERNIKITFSKLEKRVSVIEERLEALGEQDRLKYTGEYRDAYLDTIVDENQGEKVRCCTWAFINSMSVAGFE